MASCHSWLRSCDFCCNLLLSSFVVILVVGFAPFCFSSLSFLLLCLGCILLIPHVCSLFIIVTLFRFLCLERSPTGRRGLVSRRLVRRRRRRKGYLCSLVLLFQFSYLFLVLQSRAGLLETGSAGRCLCFDYLVRHACVGLGFGIGCWSFWCHCCFVAVWVVTCWYW